MTSVAVIIPMRNEARYVAQCLDSILPQVEARDGIDLVCVDGMSTDGTREILTRYAAAHPRLRVLDNPAKYVPTGMNLAIRETRADVIVRLDCHAQYAPDYIESCLEVLDRTGADVVGGFMTTLPSEPTPVGHAIAAASSNWFGVGGSVFRTGGHEEREVDTVAFGCFRRQVFDRVGLYDERLLRNQDIELNSRLRKSGGRIVISPRIKLTYFNRSTYRGLSAQAFSNGLWNSYTIWLVGGGLRVRHFVPLAFVLALLVLPAMAEIWFDASEIALAAVIVSYLTLGLWMAVRAVRARQASIGLVMLTFIVLHLAYGTGTLCGILTMPFRFGLRRRSRGVRPPGKPPSEAEAEGPGAAETARGPGISCIKPMGLRHAEAAARLHLTNIPTGFLSTLGVAFLAELYRAILLCPSAFGYVWEDADGRVCGFVACAENTRRLYKEILWRRGLRLGLKLLPACERPINIRRLVETLLYPSRMWKGLPEAEVLSIAVDGSTQHKGVGTALLEAALKEFRRRGIASARVAAGRDLASANAFYERRGFELARSCEMHGLPMNIYIIHLN